MRVVFSDESGTGDEAIEPLTVVTALMFNMDTQWEPMAAALDKLAPSPEYEFKGRKLFGALRNGRQRAQADRLLRGVLQTIPDNSLFVFYGACDRAGMRAAELIAPDATPWSPQEVAFHICMDLVDKLIVTAFPNERVLWISDKSGYEAANRSRLRDLGEFTQVDKLPHVPEDMIDRLMGDPTVRPHQTPIIDPIYFGDSKESRGLQLADVCCSVITNRFRGQAIAEDYYSIIRGGIVADGIAPMFSTTMLQWLNKNRETLLNKFGADKIDGKKKRTRKL